MFKIPKNQVDNFNIALLVASCALAHFFPYRLLLFSYAVLGPAHYLTQISWLHDRRYFANFSLLAPVMGLLSFFLAVFAFRGGAEGVTYCAVILAIALGVAVIGTLPVGYKRVRWIAAGAALLPLFLVGYSPIAALFVTVLLPTVLHIFVFTASFMWAGAMKSGRRSAYLSVLVLLAGAATFLIPPNSAAVIPALEGIVFFQPVVDYLGQMGFSNAGEEHLFGFLAFAYTYHYLNWFSKAEVIHWNRMPPERLAMLITVYVVALCVYAYNYTAGFLIILMLSEAHVMLEFPLNLRTFVGIVRGKG